MSEPARQRNERGEGGRLRQEIIEAAAQLIDESGPGAITLRGVARATGVTAPSLYRHFAGVDAIVDAVLAASFAELHRAVSDGIGAHTKPVDALEAGCRAYVVYGWSHRHRFQLMFGEAGYAPDAIATFEVVRDAITACVDAGSSASEDPQADAFLLWVALHGLAVLQAPARTELRRLGPLDRIGAVDTLVTRLTRIS